MLKCVKNMLQCAEGTHHNLKSCLKYMMIMNSFAKKRNQLRMKSEAERRNDAAIERTDAV